MITSWELALISADKGGNKNPVVVLVFLLEFDVR
jgi:hypothetical protein